ncbi:MAG: hypothetical protein Q7V17_04775 [Afipia sp.]|nr:hypothetical protein [Afipia sp.]
MNAMHGRSLLKGLLLAVGIVMLMPSGSAQAEMWCRRDFDRNNPVCVFSSARDCVRAAGIMGGVCEREPLGRASAAKSCKPSHEAGAARKRRPADTAACDAS